MTDKKLAVKEMLKINIRGINFIYKLIPWNYFLGFALIAIWILIDYWTYIFLAALVDNIINGAGREELIKNAIILVGGHTAIFVSHWILAHYYYYCGSNVWELANAQLNIKIMDMDYEYMESKSIQNLRRDIDSMARDNADGGGINKLFWNFLQVIHSGINIFVMLFYTIYLAGKSSVVFREEPVKAVLFVFLFIIIFILLMGLALYKNKTAQKNIYKKNEEMLPLFRQIHFYTEEYISTEKCGKIIRMFRQQNLLSYYIEDLFSKLNNKINSIGRLDEIRNAWSGIIETVFSGMVYFILGTMVLNNAISIGSVCLYAGCINRFLFYFSKFMKVSTDLAGNTKYVKMYFDFLDIPNKKYKGTLPVEKRDDNKFSIEFSNVSFRYPGSSKYVLKDFSIKFNIGERLAVVGKNGSGKTTFIKLLCRLYDPADGEIFLNGIDIRKYDYKEYLSLFSVVFQDFKIPAFPLGQNVAASTKYNKEKAEDALRRAGLSVFLEKLPYGLDTPVYTDFDKNGVDISGGEAQKVAIARALYHDTPFVILDEPTAALDPLAEYEIYSKFDELVGTKTAVYISHRLSSCQFCNDILVIDEGRAVQRGTHNSLIKEKDGLYYKLWNTQAKYYKTGNEAG